MALPVGQQRVLDRIEDALRLSEPRLASMFAIFTRPTRHEARPPGEQLPFGGRGWRCSVLRLRHVLSARHALRYRRRRRRALSARRSEGVRLTRALILGQIIAVMAVLGLMVGLSAHGVRGACGAYPNVRLAAAHLSRSACPAQAGNTAVPAK